jgi:putative membrane protein
MIRLMSNAARSSMRHARKRRRRPTNSRESVQGHQHFRRVLKDEARRIASNIAKLPGAAGEAVTITVGGVQVMTKCVVPLSISVVAATPRFPMIKRYSDHAANERTFLAWVRTAIAVMAFGFIIERFDQLAAHGERFANWAGLAFIVIGVITIAVAGVRFTKTAKNIDTDAEVPSPGERFDLALAIMIGLLGASLALYLSRAVLPTL